MSIKIPSQNIAINVSNCIQFNQKMLNFDETYYNVCKKYEAYYNTLIINNNLLNVKDIKFRNLENQKKRFGF